MGPVCRLIRHSFAHNFNADTLTGWMCRHLISVGRDGALFDCDFDQMLELPPNQCVRNVRNLAVIHAAPHANFSAVRLRATLNHVESEGPS